MRVLVLLCCVLFGGFAGAQDAETAIGRTDCAGCHDVADTFAMGLHGSAMKALDPAILERSCETCHGSATEHVEDPNPENITSKPVSDVCVACHSDQASRLGLETAAHVRRGVACLDCHTPGHGDSNESLLQNEPIVLCGSCHTTQRNASNLPFAHREASDPFQCTECHSLHGNERTARLKLGGNGAACINCHTEKAGPHIFPHPPREIDGCVTCHEAHGSPNPRLLKRRSVSALCLECHATVPSFHNLSRTRYQACVSCHNAIHGSNRDARFFDE